jgi:phasin family protein
MAQPETASKPDDSAEKAYAEAAAEVKPAKGIPLVESLKADAAEVTAAKTEAKPIPVAPAAAEKAPSKKVSAPAKKASAPAKKASAPAKKAIATKPAAKKPVTAKITAKPAAAPVKTPATAKSKPTKLTKLTKPTKPSVTKLKEKIMATKTPDYTNVLTSTVTNAVKEVQERTQAAYEKSTSAITEVSEFAKGNVEAVVESGKIFAEGVQSLGKSYADEAKSAYETATADIKEMASIKSPTDLFQLQGKIMRRNFDAMIAMTSKATDASMKLANEAIAPISGRVNLAAEKLSKVA